MGYGVEMTKAEKLLLRPPVEDNFSLEHRMKSFSGNSLEILENGNLERLNYHDLLLFHGGKAIWGASVGFRAMQAAGYGLSSKRLWDRNFLSIVSDHPGPGVRDAIEYVTRMRESKSLSLVASYRTCPLSQGHAISLVDYPRGQDNSGSTSQTGLFRLDSLNC